ncbi:MAG: T9SS type A sorting domain-containing protein [Lewinellaceae bacterium]|nr:T9SS type A sorting domain-containing protein [Lewinellaceae bacterium]
MNDIQAVFGSCQLAVPYFNERGFAGIYLGNAGSVNLLPLGYASQNTFHDLAVGIDAYDTELSINRNCRFSRILPGAYMISTFESYGGVAVRFKDGTAQGVNGIRYRGNGMFASNPSPDFDDCACGFYLASEILSTSTTGTRIQITECRMLKQHTGVFISNYCSAATYTGNSNNFFRGIQNNYIKVNPSTQFPDLLPLTGIFLADFTPAQSAPEIARNIIDVNQVNNTCNSSGIRTQGLSADVLEQANIHRNTVNVNQGSNGIMLGNYSGAWVHDNSDAGHAGAGIFINHQCIDGINNFSAGITVSGSHNNLVGCNDIISTAPNTRDLAVTFHQNGTYTRNNLVNGRYGAIFRLSATGTRFACNTMSNYTENGLRYEAGANTGLQGTPDTTFGNQWINVNPALLGAFIDLITVNPNASNYFVRNAAGESPSNNAPVNIWFVPNVPSNIPPTCHYDCPITAPLFFADEITAWDDSVASGAAGYVYFPEAARWIDERHLYEKLYHNPALVSGNPVMDAFVNAHQYSPVAGLVEAGERIRALYAIDAAQKAALESQAEVIDTLLLQKTLLDSLLAQTTDPVEQETGQALRDSLVQELMVAQSASETLALELTQQRLNGIAGTLALLGNIAPANVYEANEKEVLRIYLESFVSGLQPSPEMIDTLYAIGSACPYVNGPAVYNARSLYEKYTGISLPDVDCPEVEERDSKAGVKMTDAGIRVYPNPADQALNTSIPANAPAGNYRLQLFNTLGEKVSDATIYPGDNRTPSNTLPGGIYLARITRDGLDLYSTAIIIRH